MEAIKVFDLLRRRAVVTRESARSLSTALLAALQRCGGQVVLDFAGVEAVTPSFVDEVLSVIDESLEHSQRTSLSVVILNPPTRLSAKFSAVGRTHGLQIAEAPTGAWVVKQQVPQADSGT